MTIATSTRLADGRELIYFDDGTQAKSHKSLDTRPLDARSQENTGELRFDALTGDWVAVAAHRQTRTYLPPANQCPLCPTTGENLSEIPDSAYDVAVFENRFPSLGPAVGSIPESPQWGTMGRAFGRCEVVAFTPEHTGSFAGLSEERARTVIDAWAHRTEALSALPGVKQVFPFENRGQDIGVTLHHPHGQIYAYSYVPPRSQVMAAAARDFYDAHNGGATLLGNILTNESESGERMIAQGQHFSAYVPFAAHMPLEVHLTPHRHVPDFAALNDAERDELASMYLDVLRRLDSLYDSPTPYIAAWHQAPLDSVLRPAGRFHLELTSPRRAADKLKFLAGSEAAMGAFINDTTPEQVAALLRNTPGSPTSSSTSGSLSGMDSRTQKAGLL
ncbi:galactose-1-phosphate uridylyltransferase [Arthrobacter psychrochitiniphilus]|uniref:Galactose-1-phosphate uridylyltransferase n=1 Tax=Arthrobacter psychrochitiniphilus TaxID=291045 RepID=A0A2V3DVP7_9MICC|nr:galactose-1-phosphate uridylyltransferase [Arthrobacter psychrochitiniphilus]NYG16479.1 UDPglucose--hexose-1-phosphate uridylyltransferase [Arthrobacter psychrochitiniphilus]PXA69381.1 galactose-1-phosphate uridylyltransferase [Arthrobacter psychrochitiniphilus]